MGNFTNFADPDWIPKLIKGLDKIARHRNHELERLNKVMGQPPKALAQRYVEPYVQFVNPADHLSVEPPLLAYRETLQLWLSRFLAIQDVEKNGNHVLFVLGDAGMGKTSALMMLKIWHMTQFVPPGFSMHLEKLGAETLGNLKKIDSCSKAVVLLDALDEDPQAQGRVEERLVELLDATKPFKKVVITCRTQFFPPGGTHSVVSDRQVEVGGYVCNLLYLSPFYPDQVDLYLRKAFPQPGPAFFWKLLPNFDTKKRKAARALLDPMRDLRMRPLLLSYVDQLLKIPSLQDLKTAPSLYRVFKALVDAWLLREETKIRRLKDTKESHTAEELRSICRLLAFRMVQLGRMSISADDLQNVLDARQRNRLQVIDVTGRSLLNRTSDEDFRFAHRTIQEFLVIEYMAHQIESNKEPESLDASDEMVEFYLSAVRDDPDFANLTPFLKVGMVKDLASVIWPADAALHVDPSRWRFPDLDFRQAQLQERNLSRQVLKHLSFSGADFSGADFSGADFSGADLSGADLSGADLSGADLSGAELKDCRLTGARLGNVRWDGAKAGEISLDLFRWLNTPKDGRVPLWKTIPAGKGWIGSPEHEEGRFDSEGPRHRISLARDFQLMAVPVTRAQFAVFDPSKADAEHPNHPVVEVSWDEATAFCAWLAKLPGFEGARLPTEEEWEYACRAGSETRYWSGNTENSLAEIGWYGGNSSHQAHAVGEKPANPWGLYDMHGNAWEWTASQWKNDYSGQASGITVDPAEAPADLADASPRVDRVSRGGSFWVHARRARSAVRNGYVPGIRDGDLGFRVLLPSAPSDP